MAEADDAVDQRHERPAESTESGSGQTVPRFDPASDRKSIEQRAETVANEATDGEIDVYRGDYTGRKDAFEDGYSNGYEHGYTEGFQAGIDGRPGFGDRFEWNPASIGDATGRGASLAFVAAMLGAVGYYGLEAIRAGTTELGAALPTPVYLLAFALLFALGLIRHLRDGIAGLLFAAAFAGLLGVLTMFAVEGSLVLFEEPSLATEGAAGAAVFAATLVLAFTGYWALLSAVEWDARKTARANARTYTANRARSRSNDGR